MKTLTDPGTKKGGAYRSNDIHTHIGCLEIDDIEDCFGRLSELITEIKDNKIIVYVTDSNVYDWINYKSLIENEARKGKVFQKYFWTNN